MDEERKPFGVCEITKNLHTGIGIEGKDSSVYWPFTTLTLSLGLNICDFRLKS